jgi:uncharacterized OB-fold protein
VNAPHPRPAPAASHDAKFWEAIAAGELRIQRCADCATYRHPPAPLCATCGATADEWPVASGRGEVWSYTVIHPPTLPAFADRTPYGAVVVRLDEGVFMVSNVVDCAVDDLAVGMRVEAAITTFDDDVALPLFRRSGA